MLTRRYTTTLLAAFGAVLACLLPSSAAASQTGGAAYHPAPKKAKVVNGHAVAPAGAPEEVKKVIKAANRIAEKPYRYGGGHGQWEDSAYDCSGAVSYALHGAKLISSPEPSGQLESWGQSGTGRWITVYANSGHAFMVVAGLRFDTGWRDDYGQSHGDAPGSGPRWGKPRPTSGYVARHPKNL